MENIKEGFGVYFVVELERCLYVSVNVSILSTQREYFYLVFFFGDRCCSLFLSLLWCVLLYNPKFTVDADMFFFCVSSFVIAFYPQPLDSSSPPARFSGTTSPQSCLSLFQLLSPFVHWGKFTLILELITDISW